MPVVLQIALGSILLVGCAFIHIWFIVWLIRQLLRRRTEVNNAAAGSVFLASSSVFLVLLFSHTIQIYIWALSLWGLGALPGYEQPIYFSLVTYTTLGYGDITLGAEYRILGAMASVNGILAFGLSTALLVGFFSRQFKTPAS